MAVRVLRFRNANREVFEAIKDGKKKIETRAATQRYRLIRAGDMIIFMCGKSKFKKTITRAEIFKSADAILRKYRPSEINPKIKTIKEAKEMWKSFPGYKTKIKKYGLMAWKLK